MKRLNLPQNVNLTVLLFAERGVDKTHLDEVLRWFERQWHASQKMRPLAAGELELSMGFWESGGNRALGAELGRARDDAGAGGVEAADSPRGGIDFEVVIASAYFAGRISDRCLLHSRRPPG